MIYCGEDLGYIKSCDACDAPDYDKNFVRCDGCQIALYCSSEHRESHRSEHDPRCNMIKDVETQRRRRSFLPPLDTSRSLLDMLEVHVTFRLGVALRLGQEQECYDLLKRFKTDEEWIHGHGFPPAKPTDPLAHLRDNRLGPELGQLFCAQLLHIRRLIDLQTFKISEGVNSKGPTAGTHRYDQGESGW